jgi:ribosome-associated heat shock protein Hsp15
VADEVRLDVWLDVACLARTRSQAKEMCDGGRIEVNGQAAKPHRSVRVGDRIRLIFGAFDRREILVKALADRHLAKARARELYDDVTPPPTEADIELRALRRMAPPPAPPRGSGRPEKRDRRRMERVRGR